VVDVISGQLLPLGMAHELERFLVEKKEKKEMRKRFIKWKKKKKKRNPDPFPRNPGNPFPRNPDLFPRYPGKGILITQP